MMIPFFFLYAYTICATSPINIFITHEAKWTLYSAYTIYFINNTHDKLAWLSFCGSSCSYKYAALDAASLTVIRFFLIFHFLVKIIREKRIDFSDSFFFSHFYRCFVCIYFVSRFWLRCFNFAVYFICDSKIIDDATILST